MATHGFIEVKFEEEDINERTLIHAVHDGYIDNMLSDILSLPFHISYLLKKKYIMNENVPYFLVNSNFNHRNFIYDMYDNDSDINKQTILGIINTKKYKSYNSMLAKWSSAIPLDNTRQSISSYLISYRPDKYQIAKEPFILYGGEVKSADIDINFTNKRLNTAIITINSGEEYFEEESSHLILIKEINNFLTEKDSKIIVLEKGKKIIMNFDKILVDLFYHKKI